MAHRISKFAQFKDLRARIVVATNLLGRGIDVERINVVVNYDMPAEADTYLHRVGRAGRFGTKGLAISFVSTKDDGEVLNKVQSLFLVDIPELKPDTEIPKSSYSKFSLNWLLIIITDSNSRHSASIILGGLLSPTQRPTLVN